MAAAAVASAAQTKGGKAAIGAGAIVVVLILLVILLPLLKFSKKTTEDAARVAGAATGAAATTAEDAEVILARLTGSITDASLLITPQAYAAPSLKEPLDDDPAKPTLTLTARKTHDHPHIIGFIGPTHHVEWTVQVKDQAGRPVPRATIFADGTLLGDLAGGIWGNRKGLGDTNDRGYFVVSQKFPALLGIGGGNRLFIWAEKTGYNSSNRKGVDV